MQQLLSDAYTRVSNSSSSIGKANILNNIVQLKVAQPQLRNYHQDFSLDVKSYILSLIEVAEMAPKNYDGIKKKKIEELFDQLDSTDRIFYLNFLIRNLQKNNFEEEVEIFQQLKIKYEIIIASKNLYKPTHLFNFIINLSLYNLASLVATLFFIATLICLVLFPAPNSFMETINFKIEYHIYSSNFITNHFTNILSLIVGANEDIKIIGLDVKSALILIIFKVFVYIYVSTLVLNKLNNILER